MLKSVEVLYTLICKKDSPLKCFSKKRAGSEGKLNSTARHSNGAFSKGMQTLLDRRVNGLISDKSNHAVHSENFDSSGIDILVNAKKVLWIVLSLNFYKPIVIISVSRFDTVESLVHHEVYISTAQTIGV